MVLMSLSDPNVKGSNDVGGSMSRGNIGPKPYPTNTFLSFLVSECLVVKAKTLQPLLCKLFQAQLLKPLFSLG